jgi:hypothetical protein
MSDKKPSNEDILKCCVLCILPGVVFGLIVQEGFYGLAAGYGLATVLLALLGIKGEIERGNP